MFSHARLSLMLLRDSSLLLLHLFIVLDCLPSSPFSYVHAWIFGRINLVTALWNCLPSTSLHLQRSTVSRFLSGPLCPQSAQFIHVTPQLGQFRQPPAVNLHKRELSARQDLPMPLVVHQLLQSLPPRGKLHKWRHNHLLHHVVHQWRPNSPLQ